MSRQFAVTAMAAGVMLWAVGHLPAAAITTDACVVPDTSGTGTRRGSDEDRFRREIDSRVEALRAVANLSGKSATDVSQHVYCLSRSYAELSGEQQSGVNTGSHVVAVGAGAGLLSGSYPVWERAFGYAAFTPILFNQITALEPKRDLYAGARIGVDRITERYGALDQAGAEVKAIEDRAGSIDEVCAPVWVSMRQAAGNATSAIVSEAQRLATQCDALHRANVDHRLIRQDFELLEAQLPLQYAVDVVAFHENLKQRHRDMLFTPGETLTAILASPFRAADQLLTGQNGQQAVGQIRTQKAFEGLGQRLSPLTYRLTRPAAAVGDHIPVPDALLIATEDPTTGNLRTAARQIDNLRTEQRRDRARVQRLLDAADRTELSFNYSATSGAVRISLDKATAAPVSP